MSGKDTTESKFTKDTSYDSSKTPILVNSTGNIAKGGTLKYLDEDNHLVKFVATDENELTISIDFNYDGVFSEDEIFIAIDPDDIGTGEGSSDGDVGPIDVPEEHISLSDWLGKHSATDTTDVYIVLPGKFITPINDGEISIQMVEIDIEATKKQILDFVNENDLTRNDSIDDALESGIEPMFQINLTKEKIESLLAKYGENELWIELVNSVTVVN